MELLVSFWRRKQIRKNTRKFVFLIEFHISHEEDEMFYGLDIAWFRMLVRCEVIRCCKY